MKFTTRYATMEDLDMMVEIEEAAMPGYANYLRDVSNYFFNECPGKISIAVGGNLNYNLSLDDARMILIEELKPKKEVLLDDEFEEEEEDNNERA